MRRLRMLTRHLDLKSAIVLLYRVVLCMSSWRLCPGRAGATRAGARKQAGDYRSAGAAERHANTGSQSARLHVNLLVMLLLLLVSGISALDPCSTGMSPVLVACGTCPGAPAQAKLAMA